MYLLYWVYVRLKATWALAGCWLAVCDCYLHFEHLNIRYHQPCACIGCFFGSIWFRLVQSSVALVGQGRTDNHTGWSVMSNIHGGWSVGACAGHHSHTQRGRTDNHTGWSVGDD